mmetsp:Transcript_46682/g.129932  ORF Transcript_46682/g.129932 Transcript_46682/m.129932 type:complete len:310 (-) Transcript_46682:214-1143(-)
MPAPTARRKRDSSQHIAHAFHDPRDVLLFGSRHSRLLVLRGKGNIFVVDFLHCQPLGVVVQRWRRVLAAPGLPFALALALARLRRGQRVQKRLALRVDVENLEEIAVGNAPVDRQEAREGPVFVRHHRWKLQLQLSREPECRLQPLEQVHSGGASQHVAIHVSTQIPLDVVVGQRRVYVAVLPNASRPILRYKDIHRLGEALQSHNVPLAHVMRAETGMLVVRRKLVMGREVVPRPERAAEPRDAEVADAHHTRVPEVKDLGSHPAPVVVLAQKVGRFVQPTDEERSHVRCFRAGIILVEILHRLILHR